LGFERDLAGRVVAFAAMDSLEHPGLLGQTLAGIASLGACFLVWTGLALSWRRFF